jgi:hypothetical protein
MYRMKKLNRQERAEKPQTASHAALSDIGNPVSLVYRSVSSEIGAGKSSRSDSEQNQAHYRDEPDYRRQQNQ